MLKANNYKFILVHQNRIFKKCYACGQGESLIVQDLASKEDSIMCDDCECQWDNPDAFAIDRRMADNDNKVRDATQEEIEKIGWMQFIKTDL